MRPIEPDHAGLLVVGPGGFPGTAEEIDRLLPLAIPAKLAGPCLVGIVWAVVGAVALANHGRLSRRPLGTESRSGT